MKNLFVIYSDGVENIITTIKKESDMLRMCFKDHGGEGDRNLEDFEREESKENSVSISCGSYRDW